MKEKNVKLYIIGVIIVIIIVIIGIFIKSNMIGNKQDYAEENKENDKITQLKSQYMRFEWNIDIPLTEVKDICLYCYGEQYFITNDGSLYVYSDKLFSNNKHYKKIESEKTFSRFLDQYVITTDNILMHIDKDYNLEEIKYYHSKETNEIQKVYTQGQVPNNYIELEDNTFYYYDYDAFKFKYEKKEIGKFPVNNEIFLGQYGYIFKTDKGYYKYGITNQEEVNKYADVERKYGIVRVDEISDIYDEILIYNGEFLVFKNDLEHIYCTYDYTKVY